MSDEQTLLLVLAIIYIADCLYWIPRSGLSVTNWLGRSWKLRAPSVLVGNERGSLGLANPLPPLGLATRCQGFPIAIMESGLLAPGGALLPWSQIKSIQREEKKDLHQRPTILQSRHRIFLALARRRNRPPP